MHGECGESTQVYLSWVPTRKRPNMLGLTLTLATVPSSRGIYIDVVPIAGDERLRAERCSIVVRLWSEGPGVIRGTISHGSGAIAHFQGGKPLRDFARALHLRIEHFDDEEASDQR